MNAVPITIACVPLSLYLLRLGMLNLKRRPTVASGSSDAAALAFAVSGLAIVGPINLFLPETATQRFGPFVWILLLGFYVLCVVLYVLVARPRLIVFNLRLEQLRPVLEQTARRLDADARLAGDAVQLPQLTVQFHLDGMPTMRNVSLLATGDQQSHSGWARLQRELTTDLSTVVVPPNPRGFTFLSLGLLFLGWPVVQLLQTPSHLVAQQLHDMLRM